MTLQERLCLARAGYSAQDIAGFEQAENSGKQLPADSPEQPPVDPPAPEQPPAEPPVQGENAPAWAVALEQSIKALTAAQQARNVKFDDMGEPASVEDSALKALHEYVNGGKTE